MTSDQPKLITLFVRVPNWDAGLIMTRHEKAPTLDYTETRPRGYPEKGESWVFVEMDRANLPEAYAPPDGDFCYRLDLSHLRQARRVHVVPIEKLVQDAIARLDQPYTLSDFPFGQHQANRTWREAIAAGVVTNRVWREAYQRTQTEAQPASAPNEPNSPSLTVRPPTMRSREVTANEVHAARQLTWLVRWELLRCGGIHARTVVAQPSLFPTQDDLRSIPIEFLHLYEGDVPHPDAELQQGILLMVYLLYAANLETEPSLDRLPKDPMRDVKLGEVIRHRPMKDPISDRLMMAIFRLIGVYDAPEMMMLAGASSSDPLLAQKQREIFDDRTWVYETLVLEFFRRHVP